MIQLHQMEVVPGDPERNLARIKAGIQSGADAGADLVVFPELALTGYLLGDRWENDAFLRELAEMNQEIVAYTSGRVAAIWGSILPIFSDHPSVLGKVPILGRRGEDGRTRKYNAAFVAANGEPVENGIFAGYTPKSLLPKYREFDDERHFYSLLKLAQELGLDPAALIAPFELPIAGQPTKIGVLLCEDIWDDDYAFKPAEVLHSKATQVILNLSASPFGIGKQAKRDRILSAKSVGHDYYYVNCVGSQDNGKNVFIFDGASPIYRDGIKVAQGPNFKDSVVSLESGIAPEPVEISKIHDALLEGLRATFERIGAKKAVIGLSGGIDSAVVATLCVEVLGCANVIGVNMPSRFNTDTTKGLARQLAGNLGIRYLVASVEEAANLTRQQIQDLTGRPVIGLVDENIQARDRSSRILAGLAAQEGAIFTNNGNKTELAQGYCTLYGDVDGAVAPIADLYKTQVYALAGVLNEKLFNVIPAGILAIKPTAELSDAQNPDKGGGDPFVFDYHDRLLYQLIELRRDPEDLLNDAIEGLLEKTLDLPEDQSVIGPNGFFSSMAAFITDLETVAGRIQSSFFKRVQAPPILTVSKRAFGFDLREFQGRVHFTRRFRQLKTKVLDPNLSSSTLNQLGETNVKTFKGSN